MDGSATQAFGRSFITKWSSLVLVIGCAWVAAANFAAGVYWIVPIWLILAAASGLRLRHALRTPYVVISPESITLYESLRPPVSVEWSALATMERIGDSSLLLRRIDGGKLRVSLWTLAAENREPVTAAIRAHLVADAAAN
jgi:hypothetical protein